MHAEHPVVESDEFGVLPIGIHQVDEVSQLFEAKKKKQMRIPMSPEMPKARAEGYTVAQRALFRAGGGRAKQEDDCGDDGLRANQLPGMRKIPGEDGNHSAGESQIAQRDMLKGTQRRPGAREVPAQHGGPA